jgi:hypothetical protein
MRCTIMQTAFMQVTGSNPVLAVHDIDLSAAWFCRVLGCERRDPDPGNWAFCTAGAVTFMLGRCPDVPWGRRELALQSPDGHRFMLGQPRSA